MEYTRKKLWVVSLVAFMIVSAAAPYGEVYAAGGGLTSTSIPATCRIAEGIPEGRGSFTYELMAGEEDTPMPDDKEGGSKTVVMKSSGVIDFGEIEYDHPDVYSYTLRETSAEWGKFKRDHTVYSARVIVGADDVKIMFNKDKGGKTDKAMFVNTYRRPEVRSHAPKTGDDVTELVLAVIAVMASLFMFFFAVRGWRNHHEE